MKPSRETPMKDRGSLHRLNVGASPTPLSACQSTCAFVQLATLPLCCLWLLGKKPRQKKVKLESFVLLKLIISMCGKNQGLKFGVSGTSQKMSWRFKKKCSYSQTFQQIKNTFAKYRAVVACCKNPTRRQLLCFYSKSLYSFFRDWSHVWTEVI